MAREPAPNARDAAVWLPVADLRPNPRNPRLHGSEVAALARTILRTAWGAPIVAQARGRRIIGGHGRLEAAKRILQGLEVDGELRGGAEHSFGGPPGCVPVRLVDVSDAEADAMTLADNARGLQGSDSAEAIVAMAAGFARDAAVMADMGFDGAALDALVKAAGDAVLAQGEEPRERVEVEEDEAPVDRAEELRVKWNVKPGQLWAVGDHRILCGDCRVPEDVDRLLGGRKINLAFTSPPYADRRDYDAASGFRPIAPDDYVAWFEPVQANVRAHLADDGSWFVNIKPGVTADGLNTDLYVFDLVIAHVRRWSWHFATEFCWERNGVPKAVSRRFKNQFEPVYQFATGAWKMRPRNVMHRSDAVPVNVGKGGGNTDWSGRGGQFSQGQNGGALGADREIGAGMAFPGNRLPHFRETHEATGHTAAFPVGLPSFFVQAYSDDADVVFDPFLGSGSTIVAAHKTGRVGYGTELSPKYVAVALERLTALGLTPRLLDA